VFAGRRLTALDVVLEVVEKRRSDADELDATIHIYSPRPP
jgi:hypothetical protein